MQYVEDSNMTATVAQLNKNTPGYNIYLTADRKIVVEKLHLGGTTHAGVYNTVEELLHALKCSTSCE